MRKQVLAVTIGVLLVLSVFSVLQWQIKPVQATTFFSDNLEGADSNFATWTATFFESPSTNISLTTSNVIDGFYSATMTASGGWHPTYIYKTLSSAYTTLYLSFKVNFSALPASNTNWAVLAGLGDSAFGLTGSGNNYFSLYNAGGTTYFSATQDGSIMSDIVASANTVYIVTYELSRPSSNMIVSLWINNVATNISSYDTGWNPVANPQKIALDAIASNTGFTVIYDNVVVSDTYDLDVSPPTYSNLAVNTTVAGASGLFSIYVQDDYQLSTYVFGTNNSGTFTNQTGFLSGTSSWTNITKTLNSTIGYKITYQYWFSDTTNNNATTGLQLFTLTADSAPTYSTVSVSTTSAGQSATFSCLMSDDIGLSKWMFGTNNTGTWTNDSSSWTSFSGNPAWANSTKTLNITADHKVSYEWWFNDMSNNYVNTGIQSFTITAALLNLTITATPIDVGYTINSTSLGGYSFVAASGNSSDIQIAVDNVHAQGNGTVYIPSGNYTFNINYDHNVSLYTTGPSGVHSYAGVNIIGAGMNKTVLILNYTGLPTAIYAVYMFVFEAKKNNDNAPVHISGISFIGHVEGVGGVLVEYDRRCITFNSITDFRVDNCYFQDWTQGAIETYNDAPYTGMISRGVIDHCAIDNPYRDAWLPHNASAPQPWALWGYGIVIVGNLHDASHWDPNIAHYLGSYYPNLYYGGTPTPMPVYIEDCNFTRCRHAIASNDGGQYVARYCYFEKAFYGQCDQHGGVPFGGRYCEVYSNVFNLTDESYSYGQDAAIEIRGGSGVSWNNTVILNIGYGTPTLQLIAESGAPYDVRNWYTWNNTAMWTNGTTFNFNNRISGGGFVQDINYFLREPDMTNDSFTYSPYTYPHPFTESSLTSGTTNSSQILTPATYLVTVPSSAISGGLTYLFSQWQDSSTNTTLTVVLSANTTIIATYTLEATVVLVYVAPLNQTYNSPTIPIDFYASGGTIDKLWFKILNGTNIVINNQTFTSAINLTAFTDGSSYTFVGYANNTLGTVGSASVMFSVQIILPYTEITSTWWQFWW